MNEEKYIRIIDEAYKNFQKFYVVKDGNIILPPDDYINDGGELLTQEEFINKIKTDDEFSNMWRLKIEERDMTWEERVQWVMKYTDVELENLYIVEEAHKETSPTRISTIITDKERISIYL